MWRTGLTHSRDYFCFRWINPFQTLSMGHSQIDVWNNANEFGKHSIWLCFKHTKMQREDHFRVLLFVSICCRSPGTKARKTCDSRCSNTQIPQDIWFHVRILIYWPLALFIYFSSISLMGSPLLGWLYRNDLPWLRPQHHQNSHNG